MGIQHNARMTADGFNPFHPVGIGTDRQRQPLDFHMHQFPGLGDFIGIVGFVPLAQNALGASGHKEGKPLNHFLLEFNVCRDRAPIADALGNFSLNEPLRGRTGSIRPCHSPHVAELIHFNDIRNRLDLAGLYDVARNGNGCDHQAEKSRNTPLGRPADIGAVAFKPFFTPVQVRASSFFLNGRFRF